MKQEWLCNAYIFECVDKGLKVNNRRRKDLEV